MEDPQSNQDIQFSSTPFEPHSNAKKRKVERVEHSEFEKELKALIPDNVEIENSEAGWSRPSLSPIDPLKDAIIFQQIEVDDYYNYTESEPVIRFYGVTQTGHSVLCHVRGFRPYFYVSAPNGFQECHTQKLQEKLRTSVGQSNGIEKIEIVMKQNIYGYRGDQKYPFLRVTVSDPKELFKFKAKLEQGLYVEGLNAIVRVDRTYESNLNFVLRFMIDRKVTGSNWIELPPKTYKFVTEKTSDVQIEVVTNHTDFISHPAEGEWSGIAPLRVLSFDIECAGRKGIFPEASVDPVIQIASVVQAQGQKKPFIRNIFTLDTCAPIVGSQVLSFKNEKELLEKWSDFFRKVDPDVVIGYNTTNFDFPYLLERARHLGALKFPFLGRIKGFTTEAKDTRFTSKAFGTRDNKLINLEGRLQLDMLTAIQRDYKLRSYTLNSVSSEFLGEQKEDVHHSIITDLQNGNEETRRRLAVYCLKDAFLPLRLMDKLMLLFNYTEMARVTGIPFNYILVRGQQIKVVSQLYRRALEQDLVIPVIKSEVSDEAYEGATVIEPERGYYDVPIATLDFTSLYPSIMQAHNLCYTTLLNKDDVDRLKLVKDEDYVVTPNNDMFAKPHLRRGVLPEILSDLLNARKRAKADLKKEKDPFKRAVLDGRQLALKISANSVYGFTGATVGKLPCLQISSSVTSYGRAMIFKTKETVEETFCKKNGYKYDAKVIYGDTDSVMIKFGVDNLKEAMELGRESAKLVTEKFIRPINLDFEKVYYPYLLINKKRYAGLYWTKETNYDKLDTKGIETVRRDNCRLVSKTISKCLHKLLIERDVEGAQEFVKQSISDLLQNKVDISQLVITKAISKSDYANKQPHVQLADRMKKRDAGSAPALGDRVAYVIIKAGKNTPAYDRSEDPLYVLNHNIPIDTKYYLEQQLTKPIHRIFEPILGDETDKLLSGKHTRTVQVATPTIGGLMKFAVKKATCMGCKAPLKGDNSVTCTHCKDKIPELYQQQVNSLRNHQIKFSRLWTQCQRCQESLHQDVICSNNDCSIFYMRKKAQKDVKETQDKINRFDLDW
ncbi:DNA polymerase family B-domain-containing protein [Sporodiniella umbellata]|nr:DNA polymerase family B-domain-containing protein [Sporodiniella umbellata]